MAKIKKIILVGDGYYAGMAYEYFSLDSPYEVVAFAVEKAFRTQDDYCGLPVVDVEDIETSHSSDVYGFHVAITFTQLNRVRTRLFNYMRGKGYSPVSYIHPTVHVWPSAIIGEHCFIFENNVIQSSAQIGANCVLWSGNHIGHHSRIGNNCFISSHVVLAGFSEVGDSCFVGVNSSVSDNVMVGRDCVVGAGSVVNKNLADNMVTQPTPIKQVAGAKILMGVIE